MKTLLITHVDLDGISPIILLNLTNIDFEYKTIEISDIEDTFNLLFENNLKETYKNIYICDLTIPQEIYDKLDELEIDYHVFDHHASHLYALNNKNATIITNYDGVLTCGTEIFYKYLITQYKELDKPIIKEYVSLVRELDTFTFTSDAGRDLDIIREAIGKLKFIQTMTRRLKSNKKEFTFTSFEKRFTRLKKEELQRFMEKKETKMLTYIIQDKKCGIVFSENNKSELGNYLSSKHPELDLIILIDASSRISYRTTHDDVSVNTFAQTYGGGGHPKASGSRFNDDDRKKIILDYFEDAKELVIED